MLAHNDLMVEVLRDMGTIKKEHKLTGLEIPHKIFLTMEPFSIENSILTPTFKLKRNEGKKIY